MLAIKSGNIYHYNGKNPHTFAYTMQGRMIVFYLSSMSQLNLGTME